jgi:hypothetical protein
MDSDSGADHRREVDHGSVRFCAGPDTREGHAALHGTGWEDDLDWHPAPNRQYVVTLSGESEIELDGGRKLRLGPGHILLAEDTTGQGHISRAIGAGDRISLFIPLADGAVPPR